MYRMCLGHERMQRLSLDYGDQYTTDMSRTSIRGGIHDLHSPNLSTRPPLIPFSQDLPHFLTDSPLAPALQTDFEPHQTHSSRRSTSTTSDSSPSLGNVRRASAVVRAT